MRDFVAGYCNTRFGNAWHVAPAYSVLMHAGATVLPTQVIVHTPHGGNKRVDLPRNCSLLPYRADLPADDQIEIRGGLRVLTLPLALIRVPAHFFQTSATDAQLALSMLPDASDLNRALLAGGHSIVAGRLAGALRAVGRAPSAARSSRTTSSAP
jgi:hypothetical protein